MTQQPKTTPPLFMKLGQTLFGVAFLLWISLLGIPFLPLSLQFKTGLTVALLIIGEVAFWIGAIIVGKEVAQNYKKYLNPKNWKRTHKKQ